MRKTSKYELGTPDRRMPVAIFLPFSSFLRLVLPPQEKGARARQGGAGKNSQVLPGQGGSKKDAGYRR